MNAGQFKRWLAKRGCEFSTHKKGSGHLTVTRGGRKSQIPMHGDRKQLTKGLIGKVKKDLGLENE